MNVKDTITSQTRKHHHQHSMDDFMKMIKKYNLRSERYISPKPLLYMYGRNNTTNTIQKEKQRSRTLSNQKSQPSKSKRSKNKSEHKGKLNKRLQKLFGNWKAAKSRGTVSAKRQKFQPQISHANPAQFIEECGQKLKQAEKISAESKNSTAVYLCQQFLVILNKIVDKMVKNLDEQLKQIQQKIAQSVANQYTEQINTLNKKINKIDNYCLGLVQKLQNNSQLIYSLRLGTQLDFDHIFGQVVLGTDLCGGRGYGKSAQTESRISERRDHIDVEASSSKSQEINRVFKKKDLKEEFVKQFVEFSEGYDVGQSNSGRIRQAHDWEKQAFDDSQKNRMQLKTKKNRLQTQHRDQADNRQAEDQGQGQEFHPSEELYQKRRKSQ